MVTCVMVNQIHHFFSSYRTRLSHLSSSQRRRVNLLVFTHIFPDFAIKISFLHVYLVQISISWWLGVREGSHKVQSHWVPDNWCYIVIQIKAYDLWPATNVIFWQWCPICFKVQTCDPAVYKFVREHDTHLRKMCIFLGVLRIKWGRVD